MSWIGPISLLLLVLFIPALAGEISVGPEGCDYVSIQAAVDAANAGDSIDVMAGVYRERVNVTKTLILRGHGLPVVDAGGIGSPIALLADGITVEGFAAQNASVNWSADGGIRVLSSNNTIQGNRLNNTWRDIILIRSNGNAIRDNFLTGAQEGLLLLESNDNSIIGNLIIENEDDGLILDNSSRNIVRENQVIENFDDGIICINGSKENLVVDNLASGNGWHGIEMFLADNNSLYGNSAIGNGICNILLLGSDSCIVADNQACSGLNVGIFIIISDENEVVGNNASENGIAGIFIDRSYNNTLKENQVMHNGLVGLWVINSFGNEIYGNLLIDNIKFDAYDASGNRWDDGRIGNRHGQFDEPREGCKDADADTICDRSYAIPGNESVDEYPLIKDVA